MTFVNLDPPCESPIEEHFAWGLTKHINLTTVVKTQFPVSTICGNFRLDFVLIDDKGHRVAYECDGAKFHDGSRDEWRDAMILGGGHVDAIVRLPGSEINFRLNDALYLASRWDPSFFSDRGHIQLKRLASKPAHDFDPNRNPDFAVVYYRGSEAESPGPMYLRLRRTARIVPEGKRAYWQTAYTFATARGGNDLDETIAAYRSQRRTM